LSFRDPGTAVGLLRIDAVNRPREGYQFEDVPGSANPREGVLVEGIKPGRNWRAFPQSLLPACRMFRGL
jgi:hypothetical protein